MPEPCRSNDVNTTAGHRRDGCRYTSQHKGKCPKKKKKTAGAKLRSPNLEVVSLTSRVRPKNAQAVTLPMPATMSCKVAGGWLCWFWRLLSLARARDLRSRSQEPAS